MKRVVALFGAAVSVVSVFGCSGGGGGGTDLDKPPKGVFVGGSVFTSNNDYLAGAEVTLTSADGDVSTVVTNADGLYEFEDVREGVYQLNISLSGFRTVTFPVAVNAQDNDAFAPCFVPCGDDGTPTYVFLGETRLFESPPSVSISPFGVEPGFNELVADGAGGNVVEYDVSADGDIVITLSRPVVNGTTPYFINAQGFAVSSAPNLDWTVFTFTEGQVASLGIAEGQTHTIYANSLGTFGPLYGDLEQTNFTVRYRVVP